MVNAGPLGGLGCLGLGLGGGRHEGDQRIADGSICAFDCWPDGALNRTL